MRTPLWIAGLGALLAAESNAQEFTEGWEFDAKAQAVAVVSSFDDVERLPASAVLGEVSVRATGEKILQNSAKIGFRVEAKAQQDNPARAGFSGNIEPFDLLSTPPETPLRGAFSGLTRSGPVEGASIAGSIETGQLFVDGGYGQASVGYGRGVASRFHEGAPDVFTHARAVNTKLDPAGINIVRTENDLTGPAAKISYQTPRIIGFRAGVSFTPDANIAGVDRDPRRSVPGTETLSIQNVTEGSVQFSRKFVSQDMRVRASVSYATGEVDTTLNSSLSDDVSSWSMGAEFEFDTVAIGADYLSSNNGIRSDGDYTAWSAGITKEAFGWTWAARYGESEDQNINSEGQNWSLGGATKISQRLKLAAGYQRNQVDFDQLPFTNPDSASISAPQGVVVEITLSL